MQVLAEGQYIRHELYGLGVVTASDSERTTIDFEDQGEKKFVTTIWNAEIVGEPPARTARPKRPRKSTARAAK